MSHELLSAAGFVDITVTDFALPLRPADNPLGKLWLVACLLGIEAGCLRLLTRYMGCRLPRPPPSEGSAQVPYVS